MQRLHVGELRLSCSSNSDRCLGGVRYHTRKAGVDKLFLAMVAPPERIVADALHYSRASNVDRRLIGIGIDDFVRTYRQWRASRDLPSDLLRRVLEATKRYNPELKFGITVYEDELQSDVLHSIPAELRAGIDRVSLFLHYRGNGGTYGAYVSRVRKLFPNARVFGGVYAYDRMDYLPCFQGGRLHCSREQEIKLFEQTIARQARMVKDGRLAGLELYPGYFGAEEAWRGWGRARICKEDRKANCLANTVSFRDTAAEIIDEVLFRK